MTQLQALKCALDAMNNCPVGWVDYNLDERDEARKVLTEMLQTFKPRQDEMIQTFTIISCDLCPNIFAVRGTCEQPILDATKAGWRVAHTEPNETKFVHLSQWCPECVSKNTAVTTIKPADHFEMRRCEGGKS